MDWKTKALAFRMLDRLPGGKNLHFFLQRNVTRTWPRPLPTVQALVEGARAHLYYFTRHSEVGLADACFLEIGAGRDLTVPLALRMLGAGKVVTIDIQRLAKLDLVSHSAVWVARILSLAAPRFESWGDVAAFGIDYRAPIRPRDHAARRESRCIRLERGARAHPGRSAVTHLRGRREMSRAGRPVHPFD